MVCPINHSYPKEIEYCVFFGRSCVLDVRHDFEPVHSRWYLPGLYILPEWNHLENTIANSALCHSSRTFHLHQHGPQFGTLKDSTRRPTVRNFYVINSIKESQTSRGI